MSEFVTEGYYRQICEQQVIMAEQAKRIQVLGDALEYIMNFGFCAPEDLVAHCKSALKVSERMSTVDKELAEKVANNQWDSINDFLAVLAQQRAGKWQWYNNSKCKYVELRVDMRDGGCIIKDREGKRITPDMLAYQAA